jgi:hypothetical protein
MQPLFDRVLIPVVWLVFMAVSTWAVWEVGYLGIFEAALTGGPGTLQVLFDLIVACAFGTAWMVRDARARGVDPRPWALAVLALGSIPILTYAVVRGRLPQRAR